MMVPRGLLLQPPTPSSWAFHEDSFRGSDRG